MPLQNVPEVPFLRSLSRGTFVGDDQRATCMCALFLESLHFYSTREPVTLVIISQISKIHSSKGKQNPEKRKLFILMCSNSLSFLLVSWKDLVDS